MRAEQVKKSGELFQEYFPITIPPMGWYFTSELVPSTIEIAPQTRKCIFEYLDPLMEGRPLSFSKGKTGCPGASCYFGFSSPHENAGLFLSEKEGFKEKSEYGKEFYRKIEVETPQTEYLVLQKLSDIDADKKIEVINYWATPLILSGLVTLSNYDRPTNNNVAIPFASGCQSMWTLPFKEKGKENPMVIIGGMDPAMRHFIPTDILFCSFSDRRFIELSQKLTDSFASKKVWQDLLEDVR